MTRIYYPYWMMLIKTGIFLIKDTLQIHRYGYIDEEGKISNPITGITDITNQRSNLLGQRTDDR